MGGRTVGSAQFFEAPALPEGQVIFYIFEFSLHRPKTVQGLAISPQKILTHRSLQRNFLPIPGVQPLCFQAGKLLQGVSVVPPGNQLLRPEQRIEMLAVCQPSGRTEQDADGDNGDDRSCQPRSDSRKRPPCHSEDVQTRSHVHLSGRQSESAGAKNKNGPTQILFAVTRFSSI